VSKMGPLGARRDMAIRREKKLKQQKGCGCLIILFVLLASGVAWAFSS